MKTQSHSENFTLEDFALGFFYVLPRELKQRFHTGRFLSRAAKPSIYKGYYSLSLGFKRYFSSSSGQLLYARQRTYEPSGVIRKNRPENPLVWKHWKDDIASITTSWNDNSHLEPRDRVFTRPKYVARKKTERQYSMPIFRKNDVFNLKIIK